MMKKIVIINLIVVVFLACTGNNEQNRDELFTNAIQTAEQQLGYQVKLIEESGSILIPRTIYNGYVKYNSKEDWTSGFFPGTLFYMYDLTKDQKWMKAGVKYTENLDTIKYLTWHHDVGFIINSSFGNALRVTGNESYKEVIVQAAKSLSTRFRPEAGVIQSWDEDRGWQAKRGWMCPVIIDNMMNLELMFKATQFSGDSIFHKMAVSHANATLNNHYREDWSCYHVVDYDKENGGVRSKQNAQGFADESAWARGQAWGLYGFTLAYRYTKDERYLKMADNICNFIFTHDNLPEDYVPYWDFNAPNIPNEPRDASAAAIIASALYDLVHCGRKEYKLTADKIISSLMGDAYKAIVGTNGNFLLMHSVGSIPHGQEIDVPLNYADYYFLEALKKKGEIEK